MRWCPRGRRRGRTMMIRPVVRPLYDTKRCPIYTTIPPVLIIIITVTRPTSAGNGRGPPSPVRKSRRSRRSLRGISTCRWWSGSSCQRRWACRSSSWKSGTSKSHHTVLTGFYCTSFTIQLSGVIAKTMYTLKEMCGKNVGKMDLVDTPELGLVLYLTLEEYWQCTMLLRHVLSADLKKD